MEVFLNHTFSELPHVHILLASLIGSALDYGGVSHAAYNSHLPGLVQQYSGQGYKINFVDMEKESGIGTYCDKIDCCPLAIHPNTKGYTNMAGVWLKHLRAHYGESD